MTSVAPRVSVIIAAFNAAGSIARTLDSLLDQTADDWEAVVIDDGSTDDTAATVAAVADRDPRVRLHRQSNAGASRARNAGLAEARADKVTFLDADDTIGPDHLEKMLDALDRSSVEVAYCGYQRVTPDGQVMAVYPEPELGERPYEAFARRCAVAIHCVMTKRDLVLAVGGFDAGLVGCEEWDLWQRIARTGSRFVWVPGLLAPYHTRRGSLSSNVRQMLADGLAVVARGSAADPRVPHPDPRFASGLPPGNAATFLACWYTAMAAAAGQECSSLLDAVEPLPDVKDDAAWVVQAVIDGALVGALTTPDRLADLWPRLEQLMGALFDRLAAASSRSGLARRLAYALELALLRSSDLRTPIAMSTALGMRIDLRALGPVIPSDGVDTLHLRLCAGEEVLVVRELPLWGALSARDVAELAIEALGLDAFLAHSAPESRVSYWFGWGIERLSARPAMAQGGEVGVLTLEPAPAPGLSFRGRAALRTAGFDRRGQDRPSSPERARAVLAEARAGAVRPAMAPRLPDSPSSGGEPSEPWNGRQAYWEGFFTNPDPWGYTTPYERTKFEQALSLLPEASISCALELACAEGHFTAMLAPRVGHLVAADISERALERARERLVVHPDVEFRRLDLVDDELPAGLDLVVCSEVLYYLRDPGQLQEVARKVCDALKPGGWLLTAHSFVLKDDRSRTGFDWDHPFGAATIFATLAATDGLVHERSIRTELYRIDLFRRMDEEQPETAPGDAADEAVQHGPLEPLVERSVLWNGAKALRSEVGVAEATRLVPILMYHRVAEDGPAALAAYRVAPAEFTKHLWLLRRHGYHGITSADLDDHIRSNRPLPGRPVLISFDDGYKDFRDLAWPVLERADFTAEVFIPVDQVGGHADWDADHGAPAPLMDWTDILALRAAGVRFGSHLGSHRAADSLTSEELLREAANSRAMLEARLDEEVTAIAPPFGACDERFVHILRTCGYRTGFTTRDGIASLDGNPLTLPRIAVDGRWTLDGFARALGLPWPE